jgi:peptidoglycan/xylan/chitin deacetylase (PgdA/CDA1 family)
MSKKIFPKKILICGIASLLSMVTLIYCIFLSPALFVSTPVSADVRETVELPILMYHGITTDKSKVNDYTILAETFENDLKWLTSNGFTTVSTSQLIDYVENGAALPEKPVLITFDDGYSNNYNLAYPLLEKYNMKAVISIIGTESDTSSGDIYRNLFNSNLSWGEISIMASSGVVEIGNHTDNLHKQSNGRVGANIKAGESFEEYSKVLLADLLNNQEKIYAATGEMPTVFAWPYGAYPADKSADKILKEAGFKMSLTSYQKKNTIERGNPDSLFGLKRFLRTPNFDINSII